MLRRQLKKSSAFTYALLWEVGSAVQLKQMQSEKASLCIVTFLCKQTLVAVIWPIICQVHFSQHFRQWDVCMNVRLWSSELWLSINATCSWCLHGPYSLYGWSKYGEVSKIEQAHLVVRVHFQVENVHNIFPLRAMSECRSTQQADPANKGTSITFLISNLPPPPCQTFPQPNNSEFGFWVQFLLLLHVSWHVYSASN